LIAHGLAAPAMTVASGLTRLQDVLASFAALLFLLHVLIIRCPVNRFDGRFNEGAITGERRVLLELLAFQYRAGERFKKAWVSESSCNPLKRPILAWSGAIPPVTHMHPRSSHASHSSSRKE
jgi:hypothetical protein